MMKKIIALLLSAGVIMSAAAVMAEGESRFLCMQNENSKALINNSNDKLEVTTLGYNDKDENGNEIFIPVKPVIKEGVTYLPLRYVCEYFGLEDKKNKPDAVNNFEWKDGSVTIEIQGKTATLHQDEKVENEEYVQLFNEEGRVYVPLRTLTEILNIELKWDESNKNICMYNGNIGDKFLENIKEDGTANLKQEGIFSEEYSSVQEYKNANSMNYSDIFEDYDGNKKCLTNILNDGNTYYSLSKNGNDLYFADQNGIAYKVNAKYIPFVKPQKIEFEQENKNMYIDQLIYKDNGLYGIAVDTEGEYEGKIFKSGANGSGFGYKHGININNRTEYRHNNFNMFVYGDNFYLADNEANGIYKYDTTKDKLEQLVSEGVIDDQISFMVLKSVSNDSYIIVYSDGDNGYLHRIEYSISNKGIVGEEVINNNIRVLSINTDFENNIYCLCENTEGQRAVQQCTFDDIMSTQLLDNWSNERLIKLSVFNSEVYVTIDGNSEPKQLK